LSLGVVICDSCKNSEKGIKCLVKHKFKEDGKTQSEFIKILGGAFQKCDYYVQTSESEGNLEIKISIEEKDNLFLLKQDKCDAYYEMCLNPNGYVSNITLAVTDSIEKAERLKEVFEMFPLTSKILNTRPSFGDNPCLTSKNELVKSKNSYYGRCKNFFDLYSCSDSKVKREEDFYNGTDQLLKMFQAKVLKTKIEQQYICTHYDRRYLTIAFNLYTSSTGKLIL
jgi:hypothetical protein